MGEEEVIFADLTHWVLKFQTDNMKNLTEKMKNNSAAVLVPNPGKKSFHWKYFIFLLAAARAESLFFDSVPVDKIGEIIRAGMPEIYI